MTSYNKTQPIPLSKEVGKMLSEDRAQPHAATARGVKHWHFHNVILVLCNMLRNVTNYYS